MKSRPKGSNTVEVEESSEYKRPKASHVVTKIIRVKNDSFRVLKRMFRLLPGEYAAKDLDWKGFVGATNDARFLATQSGGSAVVFAREGEGSIVFHKPNSDLRLQRLSRGCCSLGGNACERDIIGRERCLLTWYLRCNV